MSKTTYTLSQQQKRDIANVVRLVLAQGGPLGGTPYAARTPTNLYVELTNSADDGHGVGRSNYIGKLYDGLVSTTAISGTATVKVRNTCEINNTSAVRSDWGVIPSSTTCGVIIGTAALRVGAGSQRHKVVDYTFIDGDWYYFITSRNDPTIYGV